MTRLGAARPGRAWLCKARQGWQAGDHGRGNRTGRKSAGKDAAFFLPVRSVKALGKGKEWCMVYKWKEDSPLAKKADPQAIAYEILTIGGASVRPKDLVQEAYLKKNSELHKCFEWDNTVAAIEYRKSQAKEILYSLVKVESTKHGPMEVLAFVESSPITHSFETVRFSVRDETERPKHETKKPKEAAPSFHQGPFAAMDETMGTPPLLKRSYDDPVPAVAKGQEQVPVEVGEEEVSERGDITELIRRLLSIQDELMAYGRFEDLGEKLGELIAQMKERTTCGASKLVASVA